MERSEAERSATACPLSGPAVLRNVMPRAMNAAPSTPESTFCNVKGNS